MPETMSLPGASMPGPKYSDVFVHFYLDRLPPLLLNHLKPGPLALADLGCGDGPLFQALERGGFISPAQPVYAVDLEAGRLRKVSKHFPYILTVQSSVECIPWIPDRSLDFVISTMVLEHVPDEVAFLSEIKRILKPQGKAYCTTVFKKKWAWYYRKREGESVLDRSHLREYTDLDYFLTLVTRSAGLSLQCLEFHVLWFPLIDPIAFRLCPDNNTLFNNSLMRLVRQVKVPIIGYYSLDFVVTP